jgi:hypothetical protein
VVGREAAPDAHNNDNAAPLQYLTVGDEVYYVAG